METNIASDVSDRIGELEREVCALRLGLDASRRRVRRIASVVACSLALMVFAGGASLMRDAFVGRVDVLGPNNDLRASINVNPEDSGVSINLLDVKGVRRLLIGVDPKGNPEIVFFDPTGQKEAKAIRPE
jgi:hypothetical protein